MSEWMHTVIVKAEDAGVPVLFSNTTLLLRVTPVNEFAPVFSSKDENVAIPESTPVGALVYRTIATDSDSSLDGEVTYTITSGNTGRVFAIGSISGNITVDAELDRETTGIYHLQITARDKASGGNDKSGTMTLHISLGDVNDNTPSFSKAFYYQGVSETTASGAEVVQVVATDKDMGTNAQLVYSIESGNERGFFTIEANTGRIRINKNLDLETASHSADHSYILNVLVTDKGTPIARNKSVVVTVEVQGVNEHTPVLSHDSYYLIKISEDTAINTTVFDINATDSDAAADGRLSSTITKGNSLGTFSIDSATGNTYI